MHKIARYLEGNLRFVTLLLVLPAAICVAAESTWRFTFDQGRLVTKSTPEELAEAKSILAHLDERTIPKSMSGGLLFDGVVTGRLSDDKVGQPVWTVRPIHILLGLKKLPKQSIVLVSPRLADGGVSLVPGREYRVFTVELDGRFYIWEATVIPISQVNSSTRH
jgi:hypothetical protein